jgi:hypothetical protein
MAKGNFLEFYYGFNKAFELSVEGLIHSTFSMLSQLSPVSMET